MTDSADQPVDVNVEFDDPQVSNETAEVVTEPPRPRGGWIRRLGVLSLVVWTGAVFAGGITLGLRQRPELPPAPPDVAVSINQVAIPDAPLDQDDASVANVIPNVLGLSPTDAQAALADAGLADGVTLTDTPVAGPAGFVIAQEPAPGATVAGTVALFISAPVPVPNVVGVPFETAREQIEQLGAQVRVRTEYRQGVPADQVISIDPAEGDLPLEVVAVVAAPPAQLNLDQLVPIENDCSRRQDFGVAGDARNEPTWACQLPATTQFRSISWDLSADVSEVTFLAGLTDDGDPAATGRIDVALDGTVVDSQPTSFGVPAEFTIPTAGALRLEIRIMTDVPDEQFDEWSRSWIAIYSIIATGGADALDELAGLNS